MPSFELLYRSIPSLNEILLERATQERLKDYPRDLLVSTARTALSRIREEIAAGVHSEASIQRRLEGFAGEIENEIQQRLLFSLRRVINATGVILHTNLGRAPLSETALDHVVEVAKGYSNLEFDLNAGARSSRNVHAEPAILRLLALKTGRPPDEIAREYRALVVNNCAAATFLALNSMAEGGEVIVSRGELIRNWRRLSHSRHSKKVRRDSAGGRHHEPDQAGGL